MNNLILNPNMSFFRSSSRVVAGAAAVTATAGLAGYTPASAEATATKKKAKPCKVCEIFMQPSTRHNYSVVVVCRWLLRGGRNQRSPHFIFGGNGAETRRRTGVFLPLKAADPLPSLPP